MTCDCGTVVIFTENNFFVSIKIEKQIRVIIHKYWDEIVEFLSKNTIEQRSISDIFDGSICKKIKNNDQKCLSLTFNSDGISLQKSNTLSLWPIQILCNFLPPELRFRRENLIISGLYYGKHKPEFLDFLTPLAEEICELQTSGIFINNQMFCVFITHASLDLPAKADVQNTVHHSGYSACMYCLHPGERIGTNVKYTYTTIQYRARTHNEMIQLMHKVHREKDLKSKDGIKGICPMIICKNFDLVWSFGIDYMHCVLIGVVPKLIEFWLDSSFHKNAFHIPNSQKNRLNKRMESIKLPRNFSRRIRSTDYRAHYKANEVRSLLLYCLSVCVNDILDSKYVNHFRLLSAAIYMLLKTNITNEDLELASKKLDEFVNNFEKLYGKSKMTLNVHLLTHLVECVKHLGPLWSFSMFCFEDYNSKLAGYVNGTTYILHQISKKYLLEHADEKMMISKPNDVQCELLHPRYTLTSSDIDLLAKEGFVEDEEEYKNGFTRYRNRKEIITSLNYTRAGKTIDYFVQMADETFGKVIFYVKCQSGNLAVIDEFRVRGMLDHIYMLERANIKKVINVTFIKDKQNHYAAKQPNSFEKD